MTLGLASTNDRFSLLRVAVVGYGSIGRRHADNLAALGVGQVVAVRRRENANPAFTPPNDVRIAESVHETIDAGVDLAIICNPTSLHTATAREYVAAGIPVLIEKPLSPSLAEAELFARDAAGQVAGMAYCLRYHPAYALARDWIDQGRLGRFELAHLWFQSYLPDWHPWEDYRQSYAARADLGGGVLPTLDHEIDFAIWCFGLPNRTTGVSYRTGTLEAEVDDAAELTLEYPTYSARIDLKLCGTYDRGFWLQGREGRLQFSFKEQRLDFFGPGEQSGGRGRWTATSSEVLWYQPNFDINAIYLAMLEDVLTAVAAKRTLPIPLAAGVDALRVIDTVRHV